MTDKPSPRAVALGARLRDLRARRFRSGSALARALGWPQSRVSKLERGAQPPTDADLAAWVEVTEAPEGTLAELQDMLTAARIQYRHYRDAWTVQGGIAAHQDEITDIDVRARRIVTYQPSMVPGLLQTPAYARAVQACPAGPRLVGASPEEIEDRMRAQDRRQARVLYAPEKRIQVAIGEAALHTRFGSAEVLAGQRDRLVAVAGLATVELAVLPFTVASPILPLAGFVVNDDAVAWVETLSGEQRLDDPAEVAVYVKAFDIVWSAAVSGDAAVEFIRTVGG